MSCFEDRLQTPNQVLRWYLKIDQQEKLIPDLHAAMEFESNSGDCQLWTLEHRNKKHVQLVHPEVAHGPNTELWHEDTSGPL